MDTNYFNLNDALDRRSGRYIGISSLRELVLCIENSVDGVGRQLLWIK